MPTGDFWFLAGIGVAMIGFGVMRYLSAKAGQDGPLQIVGPFEDDVCLHCWIEDSARYKCSCDNE